MVPCFQDFQLSLRQSLLSELFQLLRPDCGQGAGAPEEPEPAETWPDHAMRGAEPW